MNISQVMCEAVARKDAEIDRLRAEVAAVRDELRITDQLLAERNRLLKSVPACAVHGDECVPHAVEWVQVTAAQIARLREALAPFAEIADHFPKHRSHGNRPWEGVIYAWHTSGFPDAEMTVEHVHAARAALAPVEVSE